VTEAANQAGGQGFVTELAGKSGEYADALLSATDEQNLEDLAAAQYADGIDAIWAANNYYRSWDGWREAITASVTLPQGATIDDFARNPDAYRGTAEVDVEGFFDALRDDVIGPVVKTKELLASQPYLTRMYSTMSADEMTVDPAFNYNSDLGDVSRIHVAQQFIECSDDVTEYEAPWRIELPQGGVIRGEGNVWPIPIDLLPANLKVVQLSGAGSGEVVEDNSGAIGTRLFAMSDGAEPSGNAIPEPPESGMMIGGDQVVTVDMDEAARLAGSDPETGSGGDGGLCAVATPGVHGSSGAWLFGLAGVLTALVGRRRRRG
jgi:MYXO-CTERM domain-containing protein